MALLIAVAYARVRKREGFGMGDVKLLAAIGVFLGLYGCSCSSWAASSAPLTVWSRRGKRRGDARIKFPFGPFLALACGHRDAGCAGVEWYLRLLTL